jgi:NTP pyrophosphatase (non-canonical NTP hydrolase)
MDEMGCSSPVQRAAVCQVLDERDRQDRKWGSQRHLPEQQWLTILIEEVGECARAILEKDPAGLEKEIVQVSAVALAWKEAFVAARLNEN